MPMMDELVTGLTEALQAHTDHHGSVTPSDLEGRRDAYQPPPGAALGAPPAESPSNGQ